MQPHIHKAVQNPDKSYHIERDGIGLICPKTLFPNPVQLHTGGVQIQLQRLGCSTQCPFAELKEIENLVPGTATDKEKKIVYEISCEGGCKQIEVEEIVAYVEPKQAGKILGLNN